MSFLLNVLIIVIGSFFLAYLVSILLGLQQRKRLAETCGAAVEQMRRLEKTASRFIRTFDGVSGQDDRAA